MAHTLLIIDSSVIVKWLSQDNEQYLDIADRILKEAQNENVILLAPELAKYEVGNTLLLSKHLNQAHAAIALTQLYNLPIKFIPETAELAKETYRFASNLDITYYDAAFMSLAKQYNATLVTENIKHQGKDPTIQVISLKDY